MLADLHDSVSWPIRVAKRENKKGLTVHLMWLGASLKGSPVHLGSTFLGIKFFFNLLQILSNNTAV